MKTNPFSLLTVAVAGFLVLAVSCRNTNVTPTPGTGTPTGDLRVSAPFAQQTTQFAFDLAKRVMAKEGPDKNVFVSPLSLHMALGMILNGANAQTAQEIQKTLNLDAQTLAEANQTYQNLMANLPVTDPNVTLQLANSLWYRNTFAVATTFQDVLKQTFNAKVSAENFNDPATAGKINTWASENTKGKIPKVIDAIQPDNVMFLMNALYFKGDWKTPFLPASTMDAPFKLASGGETTVRMMRQKTDLRRAFRSTYAAFELPYGSGQFAMTVLLPSENTTADALLTSLTGADWTQLQKDMMLGKMDIGLPKFTLNYEVKLNDMLSDMGMPTAFTDRADFTKMNAAGGLTLSLVKQNTFVAVDEKGTEAAAVTTGEISVTTAVDFPTLCDRPFVFVIHEKTSGTVLFVGKIADPTKTNS
ncbi:serpin family protein [Spirosoma arcticum]